MYLVEYEDHYREKIDSYYLSDEQLQYTGIPSKAVELARLDLDRHAVLAIKNNDLLTFFVLHENEGVKPYSENRKAILLRTFSTDFRHQGKGYAKQSLLLLPQFIRTQFPHINEIVLAVNVKNTAAQALYKKCGYKDEGIRKMGKKGELIIMCSKL
ncbi:GNAT family N-acetyltransferase [Sporosarcina sp. Te-1]|uniref:GNAT family N-acetyltransferase n=1 Tax=Sporosarcina sp. Te-1 TaxID=2818390 RepID=UPI001A9FDB63|nr:GNAT family N-acetyltransferase [Sporosarcina sp. Te-1]QTD42122.1 GNAT family N-acetyltransferase [Sporosarcina sp. Te-1]